MGAHGTHRPPPTGPRGENLRRIFQRGTDVILGLSSGVFEQAVAYFLFAAFQPFYYDGNKRTGRYMMNGHLMSHGIDAISVPAARKQEFNTEMIDFYWQKDGTRMFRFLASCWEDAHQSFDAAMAVSTVHHWRDPVAGLREMRRVARRVVVLTFDASETGWRDRFWLTRDYLPEFAGLLAGWPSLVGLAGAIGARAEPVLIPWNCADGLFEAYWRRPGAYLEDHVRRAVSVWTRVGSQAEQRAVRSLRDDLASGRWAERNRDLVDLDAAELGLRLLVV
jgi:SAM-dependent methyltransferase